MKQEDFQASINQEIDTRIQSFANDSTVLEAYRSRCDAVVTEYNGRQIFEMLQNMDDQMTQLEKDKEKKCQIEFNKTERKLFFRNVGDPFNDKGIKSIMFPDVSPKKKLGKTCIGNKGLGFRSLLNWHPKCINIRSSNLDFQFSVSGLVEILDSCANKECAQKLKSIVVNDSSHALIPILTFPKVSSWQGSSEGWITEIELLIEDSQEGNIAIQNIEEELNQFNPELMLFLPNLCQVEIKVCDNGLVKSTFYRATEWKESWTDILCGDRRVKERTISKYEGSDNIFSTDWIAFHDDGVLKNVPLAKDESPNYRLAIAVPRDPEKRKLFEHLYNYLPLRHVSINLPCLVHATVKLDGTRDVLVIHEANRQIFSEILPKAFQIFTEMLKHSDIIDDPWLPYCMLTPPAPNGSKDYIEDFYSELRKIRSSGLYCPCVDKKYRNITECRYYNSSGDCDISAFFNKYTTLLPEYALSPVPDDFLENPCQDEDLARKINGNYEQAQLGDTESAELIYVLWNIANRDSNFGQGKFNLFWSSDHSRLLGLNPDDRAYSPLEEDDNYEQEPFSPPEFLKLTFVSKTQWQAVLKKFSPNTRYPNENQPKRYFCNHELQKVCSVHYYDKSEVTIQMISKCRKIVTGNEKSLAEKKLHISQLHRALLIGFKPGSTRDPFRKEQIPFCIYDDGHVAFAHEFLFERAKKYYQGNLPDAIFLSDAQITTFFSDKEDLLGNKSKEDYLRYIGIRGDMRIKYADITSANDPYIDFLTRLNEGGLRTHGSLEKNIIDVPRLLDSDIKIIKNLPLENIMSLLVSGRGCNCILDIIKEHAPEIRWKPRIRGQIYAVTFDNIAWNYVAFQLKGILDKLIFGESDRTLENAGLCFVEKNCQNIPIEVLERLGAHASLSGLGAVQLYGLMMSVARSKIIPTKEFYKKINTALGECELRGETLAPPSNLKVFAQDYNGGRGDYYPAKEVYYHDNPSHARMLARDCKMFYIGSRMGVDNIVRRFGVVKIDEGLIGDIQCEKVTPILQKEFEADLAAKRTCIIALLRQHRDKRNRSAEDGEAALEQLCICLVSKLTYEYGTVKEKRELGVYEYIRDIAHFSGDNKASTVFYLNVGTAQNIVDLNIGKTSSRALCKSIAGILCDVVDLSDETLENQFRNCYYDIENTRADLQEDEALDEDGELPPEPAKNMLNSHIAEMEAQFRRLSSSFVKPGIWLYLKEHNNLQPRFRDYCNAFISYYEDALEENGFAFTYCQEHRTETISKSQYFDHICEHTKQDRWWGGLPDIELDWDHMDKIANVSIPSASQYYPELEKIIRSKEDAELLSLLFFEGNDALINEKLQAIKNTTTQSAFSDKGSSNMECVLRKVQGHVAFGNVNMTSNSKKRMHVNKTGIGNAGSERKLQQQYDMGNDAEKQVLLWLKNQPGITKAERRSSAGDEIDGNDSYHYDIEYYKGEDVFYVEVKACESGVFHISASEYQFAINHPDQYQLALVISKTEFELIETNVIERIEQAREVNEWIVHVSAVKEK